MNAFESLPALNSWEQTHVSQAITRRREDTIQNCVFCSERARWHFVAHTMMPPRWMDVCDRHMKYVRGEGPL